VRLTSLEIKGFKSFPDKTTLHFNDNMTGVVGPNGCGKSNVVDAIRWVIGEQKARTLRSNKMEDLIFNGSKARNASNIAEVSLSFENTKNQLGTEFTHVRITRMYFRNGESEYRINDVPCRLKDIHNLFLDTGVSSDSYAIIELKMIEEIISDRENSRRHLFEQAAGISKYKERKKETISKLESTQIDLDRVDDLLFEIEGNLKTLEAQAKKTKKYFEFKDDYKKDSLSLASYSLIDYKNQFDTLNNQQASEQDKRIQLETEINQKEALIEKEKVAIIEKEKQLNIFQKEFNEFNNEINKQENEKNIQTEKIKFLADKTKNLKTSIENNAIQLTNLQQEIEQLQENKVDLIANLETLDEALEVAKTTLDLVKIEFEEKRKLLHDEQVKKQTIDKQYFEIEKIVAVGEAQKSSLQSEINQSAIWLASGIEQQKQLEVQLEKLTFEKNILEDQLEAAENLEASLVLNIKSIRELLDKQRQEQAIQNRQLDSKQNEYNLTKSMIEKLEGFPDSIKFLKQQNSFPKNAPLLSDIILCKDEYKSSIENLLEPYLNYYIVETLAEAVNAVHLLSDAKKGKANFFILEELQSLNIAENISIPNAIAALSIIDVDVAYRSLVNYLLANVQIVESIDLDLVKQHPSLTFITPNAKYIRSRFALSGGSVGLFEGKRLGRLKNLEKLQDEIAILKQNSIEHEDRIKAAQEQIHTENKQLQLINLATLRLKTNQIGNELIAVKTKLENNISQATNNEDRKKELLEKIEKISESQSNKALQLEQIRIQRDSFQTKIDELTIKYNDANVRLQQNTDNFNQTNIQQINLKNQLKNNEQAENFKHSQITNITLAHNQNQQLLEVSEIETNQLTSDLDIKQIQLKDYYTSKETKEKDLREIETTYHISRTEIDEKETFIKSLNKQKELADIAIATLKEKNTDLKLSLTSLKERLSIEFNADLDEIIRIGPDENIDYSELKINVVKLKDKLDKFGEINPMALEAFDEMKTRYEFIQTQKLDLVTAKTSLEETMKEIETTASEKFLTAFTQVKANFINVFQKLFNEGDQCDLYLENTDDVLESKIEVVAKPKGKRPSTITQLSGGEKALTAIALLFSLYLLKPAPFCILDEVDAPLDDNNVGKFNNMIKEFSAKSQFIIVTHNKSTMASVDVIYGVTMVEPGVSRMVPVDFRSLN
jgi:chromosome segregation protein